MMSKVKNKHVMIWLCYFCNAMIVNHKKDKYKDHEGNYLCKFCITDLESVEADNGEQNEQD